MEDTLTIGWELYTRLPDEDALLADIENFPSDQYVNWSEMNRKHGITNRNAGQIVNMP